MSRTVSTVTTTRASEAHQHRLAVLQALREASSPLSVELIGKATRLTPEEVTEAARVLLLESIIDSPRRGWLSFPDDPQQPIAADTTPWSLAA